MAPRKQQQQSTTRPSASTSDPSSTSNLNVLSEIASALTTQPHAHSSPPSDLFPDSDLLTSLPTSEIPSTAVGLGGVGTSSGVGIDTTIGPGPGTSGFTPLMGMGLEALPDVGVGSSTGHGTTNGGDFNFFAAEERSTRGNSGSALGIQVDSFHPAHDEGEEEVLEEPQPRTNAQKLQLLTQMELDSEALLAQNTAYQNVLLSLMRRLAKAASRTEDLTSTAKEYENELMGGPEMRVNAKEWEQPMLPYFKHYYGKDLPANEDGEARDLYLSTIRYMPWTTAERSTLKKEIINHNKREVASVAQQNGQNIDTALAAFPPSYFVEHTENLDWEKIALVIQRRSATDCRIQWMQHDHPSINSSKWPKEEIESLFEIVERRGKVGDWSGVAVELGTGRTPWDCLRQFRRKGATRTAWTEEEDEKLREAVALYGENWQSVARHTGRHSNQCINRWTKSLRPSIKRGKWSVEEDDLLREAVGICGNVWREVALRVKGRTDAQCRERWCNILDPMLLNRKAWDDEEVENLVRWREEGKSWSEISQGLFSGRRTDNHAMRRYNEYLKQRDNPDGGKPKRGRKRASTNEGNGAEEGTRKKKKKGKGRAVKKLEEEEENGDIVLTDGIPIEPTLLEAPARRNGSRNENGENLGVRRSTRRK